MNFPIKILLKIDHAKLGKVPQNPKMKPPWSPISSFRSRKTPSFRNCYDQFRN